MQDLGRDIARRHAGKGIGQRELRGRGLDDTQRDGRLDPQRLRATLIRQHFRHVTGGFLAADQPDIERLLNLAFGLTRYAKTSYRLREGNVAIDGLSLVTREAGFGPEVKRRIILGTYALSAGYYDAYYGSAQKVRTLVQRDFDAAFANVDVLATPTAPTTAFKLGEKLDDPLAMYLNDVATIPANLAGVPGISVPAGLAPEDGLPVGIQFLAPAREDARLYNVGGALEQMLLAEWGGPILDGAPDLSTHEMLASEEGAV